jgi:hypothetical protein
MPWTPSDAIHILILAGGLLLLLRKVAEIDGHHALRVLILTTIFSVPVILFFIGYGLTLGNPHSYSCVIDLSKPSE